MQNLYKTLETLLKSDERFVSQDGKDLLLKNLIQQKASEMDAGLIKLLLSDESLKKHFFTEIDQMLIFDKAKFIDFIYNKEFLPDSYTTFANKIGLMDDKQFMKEQRDVVLARPYKDCILEGGQDKEDAKRNEVFHNMTLAPDQITRLLKPKVLTNREHYSTDGEKQLTASDVKNLDFSKENLIIKGNNLLVLHSLKERFAGKVKLIYIDPPYNTGNDSFQYNDSFNHSTRLTFMKNRLEVAKELLRNDGVIFVQCDDNEQAYLKVIMDEVFGRENFINTVSAKMKNIAGASGGGEDKRLKKNIEFINIFAKKYFESQLENVYEYTEIYSLIEYYKQEKISWKYTSIIIDPGEKIYVTSTQDGDGNEIKIYNRKKPVFKSISQISKEECITEKEVYYKYIDKIFTTAMPQSSIRTRVVEATKGNKVELISIEYTPRSGKNKGKIYEQFYKGEKLRLITRLSDVTEIKNGEIYKKDLQGTFWDGFNLNNLSKEGDIIFDSGKKPEALLKRIIDMATQEGDIVLDYHAGSGTTGAVAHKMNRQRIAIEQMDYIKDLPQARLKKVIDGDKSGISKDVDREGGGSFVYAELKTRNQTILDRINASNDNKELISIRNEMREGGFLSVKVDTKKFDEYFDEFTELSIDDKKMFLIESLDKNMLYVPVGEIDDAKYQISDDDKALTNAFYNRTEK